MDPELHQLTLRYERLRKRQLREERALNRLARDTARATCRPVA